MLVFDKPSDEELRRFEQLEEWRADVLTVDNRVFSGREKFVSFALMDMISELGQDDDGFTRINLNQLANSCGLSRSTVIRALRRFVRGGLILRKLEADEYSNTVRVCITLTDRFNADGFSSLPSHNHGGIRK